MPAAVEVVDTATWEAVQHLARRGLLPTLAVPSQADGSPEAEERRQTRAAELLRGAERKREMSGVPCAGGFVAEAAAPARDAVELALSAVAVRHALVPDRGGAPVPESLLCGPMVARSFIDGGDVDLVRRLRAGADAPDPGALGGGTTPVVKVVFVLDDDDTIYLIHAHDLTTREKQRYRRRRR